MTDYDAYLARETARYMDADGPDPFGTEVEMYVERDDRELRVLVIVGEGKADVIGVIDDDGREQKVSRRLSWPVTLTAAEEEEAQARALVQMADDEDAARERAAEERYEARREREMER
jgi:hypothetical protein